MALLFVDSTYDITLGILNDNLEWLDLCHFSGKKASSVLQVETFNLLKKHHLKAAEISSVITIAGPGFYTGLRFSEGLADAFKFFNIPHYSFLSYEIPSLCGFTEGTWVTKAYKGEYFFHQWNGDTKEDVLVSNTNIKDYFEKLKLKKFFAHSPAALDEQSLGAIGDFITTQELLKNHSPIIFKKILAQKSHKDSYYFRAPEDEFRTSV